MRHTLRDSAGTAYVDELSGGGCQIAVIPEPGTFSPRTSWQTRYPIDLIEQVAKVESTAYLCDEIARDEDPDYVQRDLELSLLAYLEPEAFRGRTLLDFGCGGGASTMVMARMFPDTNLVGIELEPRFVQLAQALAAFYRTRNIRFLTSPSGDTLSPDVPEVDFVLLSAVYEHLLPNERAPLLSQIWQKLRPGGVLFVNQTPDLRFPIETHTTGLPFINYLPDAAAHAYACRFSPRIERNADWESLLRKGIRGTTPAAFVNALNKVSGAHEAELLRPSRLEVRSQSDIWYMAAEQRLKKRWSGAKGKFVQTAMSWARALQLPIAPYVSLAVRKSP